MSDEENAFEAVGPASDEAFARADDIDQEMETLKSAYMFDCKQLRKKLKEVRDDAQNSGVPREVFDATRTVRRHEGKIIEAKGDLAPDRKALVAFCLKRLGPLSDTPLGEAATTRLVDGIAPEIAPMTLDEAKTILAKPKGRGRPSAEVQAERARAETLVANADALSSLVDDDGVSEHVASNIVRLTGPGGIQALSSSY